MIKKIGTLCLALIIACTSLTGCGENNEKEDMPNNAITTESALKNAMLIDRDMNSSLAIKDGKILMDRRDGYWFFDEALEWENIVQVATGWSTIFGLDSDGKVHGVYAESLAEFIDLSNFTDVTYICATDADVYALKKDGTVLSTGKHALDVSDWSDIKQISASGDNEDMIIGLKNDGTVLVEAVEESVKEAEKWTDIVQVSAGRLHMAGLKKDGTVVTCGRALFEEKGDQGEFDVADWKDIIYVAADNQTTAGLKKDGTVVVTGYNKCEYTKEWKDIIAIAHGGNGVGAIKKDGTILHMSMDDVNIFE